MTSGWRLTVNVAKTHATRSNVGGASLADFAAKEPAAFTELAAQAKKALDNKPQARAAA